jgi:hypothetical protein
VSSNAPWKQYKILVLEKDNKLTFLNDLKQLYKIICHCLGKKNSLEMSSGDLLLENYLLEGNKRLFFTATVMSEIM